MIFWFKSIKLLNDRFKHLSSTNHFIPSQYVICKIFYLFFHIFSFPFLSVMKNSLVYQFGLFRLLLCAMGYTFSNNVMMELK